jgi:hypothetical protein
MHRTMRQTQRFDFRAAVENDDVSYDEEDQQQAPLSSGTPSHQSQFSGSVDYYNDNPVEGFCNMVEYASLHDDQEDEPSFQPEESKHS